MRKVRVKRDELLGVIRSNRDTHIDEHQQALEDYRLTCMAELKKKVVELEKHHDYYVAQEGKDDALHTLGVSGLTLSKPVSHVKDYDQVIKMLEMSVDETLEILSDEFACYVMDDWDWKNDFKKSTEFYAMSASAGNR